LQQVLQQAEEAEKQQEVEKEPMGQQQVHCLQVQQPLEHWGRLADVGVACSESTHALKLEA